MNKINYQRLLDTVILKNQKAGKVPSLLLHACCAPCSSYCLEYLSRYFKITVLYYNPNISPEGEYRKRVEEIKRLVSLLPAEHEITFMEGEYEPQKFYEAVKGLEKEPECGKRCLVCYKLRLEEAAKAAKKIGADYFATTLTISPLKDAQLLNSIAFELGHIHSVSALPSDFKKNNGYKRSIELSRQYNLYRQDYCGCIFSKRQREATKKEGN